MDDRQFLVTLSIATEQRSQRLHITINVTAPDARTAAMDADTWARRIAGVIFISIDQVIEL